MEIFTEERRNLRKQELCPGSHLRLLLAGLADYIKQWDLNEKEDKIVAYMVMNATINTCGGYCGCGRCLEVVDDIRKMSEAKGFHTHIVERPTAKTCGDDCDHEPMH